MLIWQTPSITRDDLDAIAACSTGTAECLVRDDNKGSVVICDDGIAPENVVEKRVTALFSAGRFGPDAGPWIFSVGVWTPEDWREEFCAWYRHEHGPMLLECREWRGFQFVEMPTERGCQFYVLHRLAARSALESEARKRSRSTPWFQRLAKNEWFDEAFERVLCKRLSLVWH
jgi:hypothetical protein